MIAPLVRGVPARLPRPFVLVRAAHTSSSSTASTSTAKRASIESTTFSAKSAPREVYHRPEAQRGMPTEGSRPTWAKNANGTTVKSAGEASGPGTDRVVAREGDPEGERFAGPSRPRAIYERPGDRDLPKIGVSILCAQPTCLTGGWRRVPGADEQKRWPWRKLLSSVVLRIQRIWAFWIL